MDNYNILEDIGKGSFGRVCKAKRIDTSEVVALKFIKKTDKAQKEIKTLKGECEIQQGLSHPNIVKMIEYFETDEELVVVSEYVPIQLCKKLQKHGKMEEDWVKKIACDLVSAIYYLHSLRILHRDIKPQNILLTHEGTAKLCDFGFSRKMGPGTYVLTSIKGTPLYMAPELFSSKGYDQKADLWSLGCILFELLTGKPPFNTTSIADLFSMIKNKQVKWPEKLSQDCHSFLQGLLEKNPEKRFGWSQLLDDPWIKNGVMLLDNSLDNPLTSPLTSGQMRIKEQQKLQAIYNHRFHPSYVQPNMIEINENKKTSLMNQTQIEQNEKFESSSEDPSDSISLLEKNIASLFVGDEKMIEKDEWIKFIDKVLVEVLDNNFDIYLTKKELELFLSPLKSKYCPIAVLDKILHLLIIPFVITDKSEMLPDIIKVYCESRVLPNLIYNYSEMQDSLFDDNLEVVSDLLNLVCHLCHKDNAFISQFCDVVCVFSLHKKISDLFSNEMTLPIVNKTIALLTQVLRSMPERHQIITDILKQCVDLEKSLTPILTSNNNYYKVCLCAFIGYSALYNCPNKAFSSNLLVGIESLKTHSDISVKKAAMFSVRCLEKSSNINSNIYFV